MFERFFAWYDRAVPKPIRFGLRLVIEAVAIVMVAPLAILVVISFGLLMITIHLSHYE